MRPAGEVRTAVLDVLRTGPCTLHDVVARSLVGYAAARSTLGNLKMAGVVQVCGNERRAHAKRWCALYEVVDSPAVHGAADDVGVAALGAVLSSWLAEGVA